MKTKQLFSNHFHSLITKYFLIALTFFLIFSFMQCKKEKENSTEKQWISLFNGKDLSGWTVKFAGHELNENYNNTFRVEDGVLKVCYF